MNIRQSGEVEVVVREMTVHRGSSINDSAWDALMRAALTKIRQRLVRINALRRSLGTAQTIDLRTPNELP